MKPKEEALALELSAQPGPVQASDYDPVRRDPESLIRFAIEKGAGVETIERLMNVRRELLAERAKKEFDEALASFQAECPVIKKEKFGAKQAYKYAELDKIVLAVQPLLRKFGFSFSLTSEIEKDWVKAIVKLTHCAGHHEFSEFKAPIDTRNPMMNDPQRYAGSMTFTKRYAFCNALGIMTCDEDQDGAGKPKPRGPSSKEADEPELRDLARELWKLLPSQVTKGQKDWELAKRWLTDELFLTPEEHGGDERAPVLTPARYREIITKIKQPKP